MVHYNIAEQFSRTPAGRYKSFGSYSGEHFRDILLEYLKNPDVDVIEINLSGLDGVGSSFWDEAFGELINKEGFSFDEIIRRIKFICNDDESLIPTINSIISDASRS